jgi:hypothetical protein
MANALPRSRKSVKVVVSRARTDGASSAPKAPCTVRAVTSIGKLTDAPPMAEAPAKPANPMINVRLRPNMSPIRPPSRRRLPKASE